MCIWTIWTYHIRWFWCPLRPLSQPMSLEIATSSRRVWPARYVRVWIQEGWGNWELPLRCYRPSYLYISIILILCVFFCTHRIGWYVVSEVYTLWDNCRSDQNTQLIFPPPSGKQLRLHGDHMEKLAAIVVWVGRAVLNNRSECPVSDKRLPNHSEDLRRKLCEVRM